MNVPRPAPIATDRVSDVTAKNAGMNIPMRSCPTPQGDGTKAVRPFPTA